MTDPHGQAPPLAWSFRHLRDEGSRVLQAGGNYLYAFTAPVRNFFNERAEWVNERMDRARRFANGRAGAVGNFVSRGVAAGAGRFSAFADYLQRAANAREASYAPQEQRRRTRENERTQHWRDYYAEEDRRQQEWGTQR
jgi:hypothetical protein